MIELALRGTTRYWLWILTLVLLIGGAVAILWLCLDGT